MGRPKKYATEEELKSAQREQKRKYAKERYSNALKEKKKTKRELYKMYEEGNLYDNKGKKVTV